MQRLVVKLVSRVNMISSIRAIMVEGGSSKFNFTESSATLDVPDLSKEIEALLAEIEALEADIEECRKEKEECVENLTTCSTTLDGVESEIIEIKEDLKPIDAVEGADGCWNYSDEYTQYFTGTCLEPGGPYNGFSSTYGAAASLCIEKTANPNEYSWTYTTVGSFSSTCSVATGTGAVVSISIGTPASPTLYFNKGIVPSGTETGLKNIPSATAVTVFGRIENFQPVQYIRIGSFTTGAGVLDPPTDLTFKAYIDVDANGNPI